MSRCFNGAKAKVTTKYLHKKRTIAITNINQINTFVYTYVCLLTISM